MFDSEEMAAAFISVSYTAYKSPRQNAASMPDNRHSRRSRSLRCNPSCSTTKATN
jgi:hypothetical protein